MPTRIKVLLIALVVAGLGIFVSLAFIGGGSGGCQLPDGIEEVLPGCDVSVQQQTAVGVRVEEGYRAELTLNGKPIPLDQVTSGGQISSNEEGQQANPAGAAQTAFLFYPPPDGELQLQPTNFMTVTYWRLIDGESSARTFRWRFNAS
jgi:hypothetical protein